MKTSNKHKEREMKGKFMRIVASLFMVVALLLGSGCSTMKVPPFTTGSADSCAQHEQTNGIVVGIHPMTDKVEIKNMFRLNLLDKGLVPILVVAENKSPAGSCIIAKDKVYLLNEATGATSTSQRKKVTSGAGEVLATTGGVMVAAGGFMLPLLVVGMPLEFTGMQKASTASVIEFNLADKEFYTHTLGPGDKAQGFVYFQFPKESPPIGNYHFIAEVKNPATGETTTFNFPVNLTFSK